MAERGYKCECGWVLRRGKLTRKQYAAEKVAHALNGRGCESLLKELKRTKPEISSTGG